MMRQEKVPPKTRLIYSLAIGLIAAAIIAKSALSNESPDGCFRISPQQALSVTEGIVSLETSGAAPETAQIVETDRVRGFVLTIDRSLRYDLEPEQLVFVESDGRKTIFIDERWGDDSHIRFNMDGEEHRKFYRFAC